MSVIRVEKTKDYTIMANYHFREKSMSLKAKGLLSFMLSLPEGWDYTMAGLTTCHKDGLDSVRSAMKELQDFGYVSVSRVRNEKGQLTDVDYVIREKPITGNPISENPTQEKHTQINTNINNILNEINTNNNIMLQKPKSQFKPPTLEEVEAYIREKNYNIDAKYFVEYYEAANWHFKDGKPVKSWKQCLVTWSRNQRSNNTTQPVQQEQPRRYEYVTMTEEEIREMQERYDRQKQEALERRNQNGNVQRLSRASLTLPHYKKE